ncbi:basic helix-loop-helix protein [Maudiozyma exigua]|uniref:Basic helix-loop-helix protein n=1 Tax=Maudiozyma exigua TaxID=34358 RepID=A0A9P6VUD8_MAUEX|nr:basic helix-loop-helix protein [Kazachstania exigua]
MDSMSDTAAAPEHNNDDNNNNAGMGLDESYDEVEQLTHKTKKQKVNNDTDNANIDSALLGETQQDQDDNDVSLQDNETNHRDVASAAVSATYDELLRDNAGHHEDIDVSVDESSEVPDTTLQTTQLDGKKTARMPEHTSDTNENENKNNDEDEDDDKSVKEQDGSTRSDVNDDSDSHKKLIKKNRRVITIAGTEEWRQQRKDSHKEVERRRRESINYHINTLSQLLPVRETSKAAILSRAAEYIEKLKVTENANIEKWTLQKLLSEQNASSLATANGKLQEELGNAYKENDFLRKLLEKNHIEIPAMDTDLEKSKDD